MIPHFVLQANDRTQHCLFFRFLKKEASDGLHKWFLPTWGPQFGYNPTYKGVYQTFYSAEFSPVLCQRIHVAKWYKKSVFFLNRPKCMLSLMCFIHSFWTTRCFSYHITYGYCAGQQLHFILSQMGLNVW